MKKYTVLAFVQFLLFAAPCVATTHVFAETDQGLWIVSDTLQTHLDGLGHAIPSTRCKVVIARGRLFLNAGIFRDLDSLMEAESRLPLEAIEATEKKVIALQRAAKVELVPPPPAGDFLLHTAILQIHQQEIQATMLDQGYTGEGYIKDISQWIPGMPHGWGTELDRVRLAAANDPAVAAKIASNPKQELLKIVEEEARLRPAEVGGPFTVLLLHKDGTVSDYSDKQVCTVPEDALYRPAKNPDGNTRK